MPTHTYPQPTTRPLSTITSKPLHWLWHPRIPRGKITLLAADPGSGKTTLALSLAAHLSRGESPPHSSPQLHSEFTDSLILNSPQATLLLSPEDNPADTLIPKLHALNANLHHIHLLENLHSFIPPKNSALSTQDSALVSPLSLLESAIQSIPNLALLIIDPITHYLGLTDRIQTLHPSDPTQLRSTLHALANLAEKYNLAILLTTRLTKSLTQSSVLSTQSLTPSLHRTLGSLAFASTARSVLLITPIPSLETRNPQLETPPTHLLISLKSNLTAPPLPLPFTLNNTLTFHPDLPLDQLTPPPPTPAPKPPTPRDLITQSAADWLRTALEDGPVTSYSIIESAKDNAIPIATLNRAKEIAHVQSVKQPWSKKWFWRLASDDRPLPENPIAKSLAEILEVDILSRISPIPKSKPDNLSRNLRLLRKEVDTLPGKMRKLHPKKTPPYSPRLAGDNRPQPTAPSPSPALSSTQNHAPTPSRRDKIPSPAITKEHSMGYESEISHGNIAAKLNSINQSHLLKFWPELTPDQQNAFATQLSNLDWDLITKLIDTMIKHPPKFELTGKVEPAPYYEHSPADPAKKQKLKDAFAHGEQLLRDGKVAAFVVAGGQGTRLGWDGPKGTYPATPIKRKPLFQCFADFLLANGKRYGKAGGAIPLYIMTSPANDQPTRDFWQKHNFFGMNPNDVMFFPQDELPAIAPDGKVLLQSKDSLALSPNGHGGSLLALHKSGAIADMKKRGITQISYFQVDNPIVRCVDPTFLGLHDLDHAQMSSKMLPKTGPKEKLGNLCLIDNKMAVIEYSDLPEDLAEARNENGELKFRAGSIALHAIRVDFVEQLNKGSFALPFHRADKKVPCIDFNTGEPITPQKPNAVKLETFVFDALPLTDKSIIYQTDRQDEFAPIKNAEGVDSAHSSIEITNARNTAWLASAGIPVPPGSLIEIAPSFALYPSDIPPKKSQIPPLPPAAKIYLE